MASSARAFNSVLLVSDVRSATGPAVSVPGRIRRTGPSLERTTGFEPATPTLATNSGTTSLATKTLTSAAHWPELMYR